MDSSAYYIHFIILGACLYVLICVFVFFAIPSYVETKRAIVIGILWFIAVPLIIAAIAGQQFHDRFLDDKRRNK